MYGNKSIKPWQPKVNEWNWFSALDGKVRDLAKLESIDNDGFIAINMIGERLWYEFSEPFKGKLPSFLKKAY